MVKLSYGYKLLAKWWPIATFVILVALSEGTLLLVRKIFEGKAYNYNLASLADVFICWVVAYGARILRRNKRILTWIDVVRWHWSGVLFGVAAGVFSRLSAQKDIIYLQAGDRWHDLIIAPILGYFFVLSLPLVCSTRKGVTLLIICSIIWLMANIIDFAIGLDVQPLWMIKHHLANGCNWYHGA